MWYDDDKDAVIKWSATAADDDGVRWWRVDTFRSNSVYNIFESRSHWKFEYVILIILE